LSIAETLAEKNEWRVSLPPFHACRTFDGATVKHETRAILKISKFARRPVPDRWYTREPENYCSRTFRHLSEDAIIYHFNFKQVLSITLQLDPLALREVGEVNAKPVDRSFLVGKIPLTEFFQL
jgi:hypothetical protein